MGELIKIERTDAVKIAYYLMAVDGHISEEEELYIKEVARGFGVMDYSILEEIRKNVEDIFNITNNLKIIYNSIESEVRKILNKIETEESETFHDKVTKKILSIEGITPNILIWNLMTMAIKDLDYSENERMLIKYIAGKLNVDESVLLEMDNSLRALYAVQNDLDWIKENVNDQKEFSNLKQGLLNRMITIEDGIKLYINEEM